jgi:hypothetical protein
MSSGGQTCTGSIDCHVARAPPVNLCSKEEDGALAGPRGIDLSMARWQQGTGVVQA